MINLKRRMRTSIGIRCCVVAPINLHMALAAREVHIAAGDDHAVAVEKCIVVDPELGVAAKVENVAVAVDLGDGNVGIARQQKVVGIGLAPGAEVIIPLSLYLIILAYSYSVYSLYRICSKSVLKLQK